MVAVLSPEWLDRRRELLGALPERPGASGRLRHVVSGGPGGELSWLEVYEDGRCTTAELVGPDDLDADITFAETWGDAVQMATGALDLHVGYMRGQVKAVGDVGTFLAVLPATQSPEAREALTALATETEI